MNKKNQKNKMIALVVSLAVLGCAATAGVIVTIISQQNQKNISVVLDSESDDAFDLSNLTSNLVITSSGAYRLTGTTTYSILIQAEANDEVTLVLDNATIEASTTAGIAGISGKSLTIITAAGSVNNVSDGGSSDYDGAIYSEIPLILEGEGILYVKGQQEEGEGIATTDQNMTINSGAIYVSSNDDGLNAGGDNGGTITINGGQLYIQAGGDGIDSNDNLVINGGEVFTIGSAAGGDAGIDTDNGYVINGGTVVALGSDMLETPENSSAQNTLAIQLESVVKAGTAISLVGSDDEIIVSFVAEQDFRTIIISSDLLEIGKSYRLYSGNSSTGEYGILASGQTTQGAAISVSGNEEMTLSSKITTVGSTTDGMMGGTPSGGSPDRAGGTPPSGNPPTGDSQSGNPPERR